MATPLRLSELDHQQRDALSNLLQKKSDNPLVIELKALSEKLKTYMRKNDYSCVRVTLRDTDGGSVDKFLRRTVTPSEKKLSLDAVVDALNSISQEQVEEQHALLAKKASTRKTPVDLSMSAIMTDLVFKHIRANYYRQSEKISLENCKLRGSTPHEASERSQQVIQRYYDVKQKLAQTKPPPRRECEVVLLDFFTRANAGDKRSLAVTQPDGTQKQVTLARRTTTTSRRPSVTLVKKQMCHTLQRFQTVKDAQQNSREVAEALLQWIQDEQEKTKTVVPKIALVQ